MRSRLKSIFFSWLMLAGLLLSLAQPGLAAPTAQPGASASDAATSPSGDAPPGPYSVTSLHTAQDCGVPNVLPGYQDLEMLATGPSTSVVKMDLPFAWRSGLSDKVEVSDPKNTFPSQMEGTGIGGAVLGYGQAVAVWKQTSVDTNNAPTYLMMQYWNEETGFSTKDLSGAAYKPYLAGFPDSSKPLGTPVVVAPSASSFYVFSRTDTSRIYLKFQNEVGISDWSQVPVPDPIVDAQGSHYWSAVSDPTVILLDPTRMLVFYLAENSLEPGKYKLILNQGSEGAWSSAPVILSGPTDGSSFTSMTPVAVAADETRAAVFLQAKNGSTYYIYGRIWTTESNKPDWSDTTLFRAAEGVNAYAGLAVGSRWRNHLALAYQKPNQQVFVREWQKAYINNGSNGWTAETPIFTAGGAASSLSIVGVDSDELILTAAVNGILYSKQWSRTGWQITPPTTLPGLISGPYTAIAQATHSVLIFGKNNTSGAPANLNKPVFYHFTDRGATVSKTANSPANLSVNADPDGQRIVTVNGKPYWLNVYPGATSWMAEVRDLNTWKGSQIALGHQPPVHRDAFRFSIAVADMDLDGIDEPVIATLNHGQTIVSLSWLALTPTNNTDTVMTIQEKGLTTISGSFGKGVSVTIGDLDSDATTSNFVETLPDGKKNEIFVSTVLSGNKSWQVNYYRFIASASDTNGGTLQAQLMKSTGQFSLTLTPLDKQTAFDSLTTVAGRFDKDQADKLVFLVGREGAATYSELTKYTLKGGQDLHSLEDPNNKFVPQYELGLNPTMLADDVDVDGLDELLVAGRSVHVMDLDDANLPKNMAAGKSSPRNDGAKRMAIGDIDQDGHKEIVMIMNSALSGHDTFIYKVSSSQNLLELAHFTQPSITPLVADLDGDSKVATFDTTVGCRTFNNALVVQGVIYTPPVYYNSARTSPLNNYQASFSTTNGTGDGTTKGWHVNFGFTFGIGIKADIILPVFGVKIGETSLMFDYEMEGKIGRSHEKTKTLDIGNGWTSRPGGVGEQTRGMVIYTSSTYTCYYYTITDPVADANGNHPSSTSEMCTPPSTTPTFHQTSIEDWYSSTGFNQIGNPSWGGWMPLTSAGVPSATIPPLNDILDPSNKYAPRAIPPVAQEFIITQLPLPKEVKASGNTSDANWWFSFTEGDTQTKKGELDHNLVITSESVINMAAWKVEGKVGGGNEWENKTSWTQNTTYGGLIGALPTTPTLSSYSFTPYLYRATGTNNAGISYTYQVLDYYVNQRPLPTSTAASGGSVLANLTAAPLAPVVQTSTHPDPDQWYGNAPAFTWSQPAGDNISLKGYRFFYTDKPVDSPENNKTKDVTQYTYANIPDGVHYFHVQAVATDGTASPVTHVAFRVDTTPPVPLIEPDPIMPSGLFGWYTQPVSLALQATDASSGMGSLEYSTDGTNWQPYTTALTFSANTASTTIYARATDQAGNVSDPVSREIKIDLDKPTVRDVNLQRLSYANITTLPNGNAQLVLGGPLDDTLSGRNTVMIQCGEDGMWNSADQVGEFDITGLPNSLYPGNDGPTTVNWLYTSTFDARGIYLISNYGLDMAGNQTTTKEIGLFWWEPDTDPVLMESQISVQPSTAHPGDTVEVTVTARNSGYQESRMAVTNTLPVGLTPVTDSIGEGGIYDANTRKVSWSLSALWPGETHIFKFSAVLAPDVAPGVLQTNLDLEGYWNWMTEYYGNPLPQERTHTFYSTSADLTVTAANQTAGAPRLMSASLYEGNLVEDPNVTLLLNTSTNAQAFYIKEWIWDNLSQQWALVKTSDWKPIENGNGLSLSEDSQGKYIRYNWQLDSHQGTHYLGAWVSDRNGHISNLNEGNLISTNLISPVMQVLQAGQKVQYRLYLQEGELALFNLITTSGTANIYAWNPRSSFHPDHYTTSQDLGNGIKLQNLAFYAPETGMYLIEVQAVNETVYQLVTVTPNHATGLSANVLGYLQVNANSAAEAKEMLLLKAREMVENGSLKLSALNNLSLPTSPFTFSSPMQNSDVMALPDMVFTFKYPLFMPIVSR